MRRGLLCMAGGLSMLISLACLAELTLDEARTVLERAFGVSLAGAAGTISTVRDTDKRIARFEVRHGRSTERFSVPVASPRDFSYALHVRRGPEEDRLEDGTTRPLDDCINAAAEFAAGPLGEASRDMSWRVDMLDNKVAGVSGRGPMAGDPPRHGLTPSCSVTLDPHSLQVLDYLQTFPEAEDPIAVEVPRDDAIRITRAHLKLPDAELAMDPELHQLGGKVMWSVLLEREDEFFDLGCVVNAVSGEVEMVFELTPPLTP